MAVTGLGIEPAPSVVPPAKVSVDLLNRLVLQLLSVRLIGRDNRYWVGRPRSHLMTFISSTKLAESLNDARIHPTIQRWYRQNPPPSLSGLFLKWVIAAAAFAL